MLVRASQGAPVAADEIVQLWAPVAADEIVQLGGPGKRAPPRV